jgi:CRISPR-associated protein Csb2
MSFTITAELPLGTYRGAGADGQPEPLPSVARLHAALLCAAGFGPRAVPTQEDDLGPCDADEAALHWLEEHPPDGVVIPELSVNRGRAVAYRDDGTIKQTHSKGVTKKLPKAPDTAVAVSGRFVWTWYDPPPPPVREALTALCCDVPYIGTTESPVRLAAGAESVEPTHELDREAGFGTGGMDDEDVDACEPGRTAELVAAHRRRRAPARTSSRAAYGTDEWSISDVPPREKIVPLRYRRHGEPAVDVPWGRVILVPLSRKITEPDCVRWAVSAHKALIRLIGLGAPPLVTGVYPGGASRPANRLALHFLDASAPVIASLSGTGTLAVLIPAVTDEADLAVVADAIDNLRSIRGPGGDLARVVGRTRVVSGARFWRPPAPGHVRLWRTEPAAVPDTRGSSDKGWTFAHAALLSLGFVWKQWLPSVAGRRDAYYRNLAQAVTDAGAAVVEARPLRTTAVGRYAHRVNPDAVVRPYRACVWLGDLAPPTAVAAIGQSRHLGGGLLVPYDVPEGQQLADMWAAGEERR